MNARRSALSLWRFHERAGLWYHERGVTADTADEWLRRYRKDEPRAIFAVSHYKPKGAPFGQSRDAAPPSSRRVPQTPNAYRFAVVASLVRGHRMTDARAGRLAQRWERLIESRRGSGHTPASTAEHVARFEEQHIVSPYPKRDPAPPRKGDRFDHFGETLVVVSVRERGREITMAKEVRDSFGKATLINHRVWHPRDLEHMRKEPAERDRTRRRRTRGSR